MPLSTAHFQSLCTECSYAKERYLVRLYAEPVDVNLPLDELPEYKATFTLSVDRKTGHAEGAMGAISAQNVTDINAKLKSLGVKTCVFERHKKGKIKRVRRVVK